MSLFTFISDTRQTNKLLTRIAEALERIAAPTPDGSVRTPAAADDVSYASDEQTAKQELMDDLKGYEEQMREQEEG